MDVSISPARPWRRPTGNSLGLIHSNSNVTGIPPIRPTLGRDIETASVVTTWTKVILQARGGSEPGGALPQADRALYQKGAEFSQVCRPMEQSRLEELARADERLARVRDVRGYIKCNVI
jgi:hypothetical protein